MKCDKCGKNEVSFYYKETVNGRTAEKHLCSACAQREGLMQQFSFVPEPFTDAFDGIFSRFFRSGELFSPFLGTAERFLPDGFASVYTMPRCSAGTAAERQYRPHGQAQSEAETAVPDDAGPELRRRRERTALEYQLSEAVRREDYETAGRLRDQLKRLS